MGRNAPREIAMKAASPSEVRAGARLFKMGSALHSWITFRKGRSVTCMGRSVNPCDNHKRYMGSSRDNPRYIRVFLSLELLMPSLIESFVRRLMRYRATRHWARIPAPSAIRYDPASIFSQSPLPPG
jgi:hypothetical protein